MQAAARGPAGALALFAASFFMYGAPLAVAAMEGFAWYVTPSFVAFHMIPGAFVSTVAIYQLLAGASRTSAIAVIAGGALMAFGPGLGPAIGILHFHVGFVLFAVAYHLVPGGTVFAIGLTQLRQARVIRSAA